MVVVVMPPATHLAVDVVHLVAVLGDKVILISGNSAVNGFAEDNVKQFHLFHPCSRK